MKTSTPPATRTACRISIRGTVQGVGFRPCVFRAAWEHRICGWVYNGEQGVEIQAEGEEACLVAFMENLRRHPPPAARIASFEVLSTTWEGLANFQIRASRHDSAPTVRVSPDLAICADCLRELRDPANRRYQYPYINCTNCGPRFSIVRGLPYDRDQTTMAAWPLCPACCEEYQNPLDRRYHAQPIACAECGPGYYLLMGAERLAPSQQAIARAAELLRGGAIVAIKGIGGYHLACDARNAAAVAALRERKYRKEKPFAVMAGDLRQARELVSLTPAHEELLLDVPRPIVLASARVELPGVAPDNDQLGILLPYAPLHYLLFDAGAPCPLVLTSANRSNEPIAYRDEEALSQLTGIADAFLIGERPIARRVDDSVATARQGRPLLVRRARGYAPGAVCQLPTARPLLALGSDLKNTVALVVRGQTFVSQHIGDLADADAQTAFEETVRDLLDMYELSPDELTVVHDLHPQFHSTRFAESLPAKERIAVQHHHAHIASVLAEHNLLGERVIGVAFDGTGYGSDGTIWGGEIFAGSVRDGFERLTSLRPVRMPGGDAAARFPVQAAASFLAELSKTPEMSAPPFRFPARFAQSLAMLDKNVRCFSSTSMGRLFDAVAALLGFTREVSFEGQAAIWLEQRARHVTLQPPYPFPELDFRPLLAAILRDRLAGRSIEEIAAAFHSGLAAATCELVRRFAIQQRVDRVVLSGGVFQNELLVQHIEQGLNAAPSLQVLINSAVPANDGGISLGQAALASFAEVKAKPPAE